MLLPLIVHRTAEYRKGGGDSGGPVWPRTQPAIHYTQAVNRRKAGGEAEFSHDSEPEVPIGVVRDVPGSKTPGGAGTHRTYPVALGRAGARARGALRHRYRYFRNY